MSSLCCLYLQTDRICDLCAWEREWTMWCWDISCCSTAFLATDGSGRLYSFLASVFSSLINVIHHSFRAGRGYEGHAEVDPRGLPLIGEFKKKFGLNHPDLNTPRFFMIIWSELKRNSWALAYIWRKRQIILFGHLSYLEITLILL